MATNFVKWWRTKFHTNANCSYKNIVLGESEVGSDVRYLVGSSGSDTDLSSSWGHINPGHRSSGSSSTVSSSIPPSELGQPLEPDNNSQKVKFEDFEFDVQLEGESGEAGEERKEFSFTFYDLDGHGKITKDDIAGLVQSIYGAVNESLTVPQGGKKTIKVKLSVANETSPLKSNKNKTENSNSPPRQTVDITTTVNMGNTPTKLSCPTPLARKSSRKSRQHHLDNSNNNNNKNHQDVPAENLKIPTENHQNCPRHQQQHQRARENVQQQFNQEQARAHFLSQKFSSVRVPGPHKSCANCTKCQNKCHGSPLRNRKKFSHLQIPDFFTLLQANMEKNHLNILPNCCNTQTQNSNSENPTPENPLEQEQTGQCTHNSLFDPNCPLLVVKDKVQNSNLPPNLFYDNYQKISSSDRFKRKEREKVDLNSNNQCRRHQNQNQNHRSRSHDLTSQNLFKYQLLSELENSDLIPSAVLNQMQNCTHHSHQHNHLNLNLPPAPCASPVQVVCIDDDLTGNQVKLTRNSIKNRGAREYLRSMNQVINWLEREQFSSSSPPGGGGGGGKNHGKNHGKNGENVKKHEHHHVHEHVHHHYHHYSSKETPIIV